MSWHTMVRIVGTCHGVPRDVVPCSAMLCRAMMRHALPCYACIMAHHGGNHCIHSGAPCCCTHAMAHHGAQWRTMLYAHRGDPWCTMVCCGMPWCAMTFYVASWCAGWTGKLYSLYARHITENESIEVTLIPHAFNANNNKTPETPQLLSLTAC